MNRGLRLEYLTAMGLETWVVRKLVAPAQHAVAQPAAVRPEAPTGAPRALATPGLARPVSAKVPIDAVPQSADREAPYDWAALRERVAACTRCGLSATRTQTVC